ncbi:MAG: single-stranded DNA-binding protein [Methanomethylophilus sp.]
MEKEELAPVIKELMTQLAGKATEGQVAKDLDRFVNTYGVTLTAAKNGILKKYGATGRSGGSFVSGNAIIKKITELKGTEMNVDVTGKAIFSEKKEITARGVGKTIVSGILGDDTGTIPFTVWNDMEINKGECYTFRGAYTKKWNDQVQLNIGIRGKVEPAPDAKFTVPSNAGGSTAPVLKIGAITEKTRNTTVTGKLLSVDPRNITVKGEPKTVYGGLIADDTGKIQYTAWNDFKLETGATYTVKNAYIRSWKGIPQLNLGDRCEVARSDAEIKVAADKNTRRTVAEIMKTGGGLDFELTGLIVDLRSGSGLIGRCPQCNRTVLNGECRTHGKVEPIMDLRLKTTIDDGTGAISVVIGRADTEKLTGISLTDAQKMAADVSTTAVENKMAAAVLTKQITVRGNVMSDDFGPQLNARSVELKPVDITAAAEKLYGEVEANL